MVEFCCFLGDRLHYLHCGNVVLCQLDQFSLFGTDSIINITVTWHFVREPEAFGPIVTPFLTLP